MTAIPRAFPQDATVIDMSHNQIKTLGEIPPLEGSGSKKIRFTQTVWALPLKWYRVAQTIYGRPNHIDHIIRTILYGSYRRYRGLNW